MADEHEHPLDRPQLDAAQQALAEKLSAAITAIEHCLEAKLIEPSLILMYATVDAMAWLDRPAGQPDVTRADFVNWVNKYLLPDSSLPCSAEDLYGARCGLLHTHTGESKVHRRLEARKLFYHRRSDGAAEAIVQLRMNEAHLPLNLDLDALVASFRRALDRFSEAAAADLQRRQLVMRRVWDSYYSDVEMLYR